MPDLSFRVEAVTARPFAAAPELAFRLVIDNAVAGETIQSVMLRCQIQIEALRRRYTEHEQVLLLDLFGEPDRWSKTLKTLLWTHVNAGVPSFTGSTTFELSVPCSYDFNIGATKYFHAIEDGDLPLLFQFSGTVFYAGEDGGLQVTQISWDREASFRLPASVWQEMMDSYYPNSMWLRLRRDAFERLYEYKLRQGLPSWELALERLLDAQAEVAPR